MSEEKRTTEQDLRNLLTQAVENADYADLCMYSSQKHPGQFMLTHGATLGSVLMSLSADRQEQMARGQAEVLAGIEKYSGRQTQILSEQQGVLTSINTCSAEQKQILSDQHAANEKQEKMQTEQHGMLKKMKAQSDAMTAHSKRMLILTYAIIAFMVLQVILQIF